MKEKKWSLGTVILYGINMVIGSGIFLLPGNAYKTMGAGSLLAYAFVLVLVMSIALCFAECGACSSVPAALLCMPRKPLAPLPVMKWGL